MPHTKIHNRKYLKDFRKELRNDLTPAEAVLWTCLQKKQFGGRKFRRQHSIGKYVVDFYCPAEKLAIELDGAGHFTQAAEKYDMRRDKYIGDLGIKVLRFENSDIFDHLEAVLEDIKVNFTS